MSELKPWETMRHDPNDDPVARVREYFTLHDPVPDSHVEPIEVGLLRALLERAEGREIRVVFDGPPGPEGGRFVEVELPNGQGVGIGRWMQVGAYWHLVLRVSDYPKKRGSDGT